MGVWSSALKLAQTHKTQALKQVKPESFQLKVQGDRAGNTATKLKKAAKRLHKALDDRLDEEKRTAGL